MSEKNHDYEATILARLAAGPIRRRSLLSGSSDGLRLAYRVLVGDGRVEEFRVGTTFSGCESGPVYVGLPGCLKPEPTKRAKAADVRCLVKAGYSKAEATEAILATDHEGLLKLLQEAIEKIEANPDPRRLFRRGRPHKKPIEWFNLSSCRKEQQKLHPETYGS
jgi:hypothetical protein